MSGIPDGLRRAVVIDGAGEMDFGISGPLNKFPDLDYTPVIADPFGVVFPRDHSLVKHKDPIRWSELKGHEYIGLTRDTGIGWILESHSELGLVSRGEPYDHASSTTSLYTLLKLGGRISVLPSLAAHSAPLTEFEFRELRDPRVERQICLITRHLRSLSPSTQRFLDVLMQTIKSMDDVFGVTIY